MDRINKYLRNKNLKKMEGTAHDLLSLYELALRSVWELEDKESRENYAVDIAHFLNPYFGGRNVAEALKVLTKKLDADTIREKQEEEIDDIKEKMNDPNYVPTFEELMKAKDAES